MSVPAGWINHDGYIGSEDPKLNGRFWVYDDLICGPVRGDSPWTGYWIEDRKIIGPDGRPSGWFVQDSCIYGPQKALPFAKAV